MNQKWKKVASELLDAAADEFANHGCNDWKWPKDWTFEDRLELAVAMISDNEGLKPEDLTEEDNEDALIMCNGIYGPPDFWVMRFLSQELNKP